MNVDYVRAWSVSCTQELQKSQRDVWVTARAELTRRGISVASTRVVDYFDDSDYLDFFLIVAGDGRVYRFFVQYEPNEPLKVDNWHEVTDIAADPFTDAIATVLRAQAGSSDG